MSLEDRNEAKEYYMHATSRMQECGNLFTGLGNGEDFAPIIGLARKAQKAADRLYRELMKMELAHRIRQCEQDIKQTRTKLADLEEGHGDDSNRS